MNGCRATANPVSMGCGSQENECGLRGHHTLPGDCACCLLKPPVGRRPASLRLVPYSANEKNVVQSPTAVHAAGQHACFLSRGHGACCHSYGQVMNKCEMIVNGPVENTRRLFFA